MLPESLTVSIENVATVGVMAGCEPEHMPVLLGMTEAFANDLFSSTVRSTCSFSFSVLVNGPVANQIGMNSGINALGSGTGNKTNATIGRFLRLAIICLGGSKSGLNDMSSIGNPSKYSFAFSENEQRSPWEPFHVSSGYRADESVVTIMSGGFSHSGPFGHLDLDRIARRIATYELPNGALIILDPMSAKSSQKGYTNSSRSISGHMRQGLRRSSRMMIFSTLHLSSLSSNQNPHPKHNSCGHRIIWTFPLTRSYRYIPEAT
jgi:hypothetical protein